MSNRKKVIINGEKMYVYFKNNLGKIVSKKDNNTGKFFVLNSDNIEISK